MDATSTEPTRYEQRPRRTRMGRKRTRFALPTHHAPSVKALWQAASLEEQAQAHRLSMAILEYWLGKTPKVEIARRLEVPPLRVWQLSQMALSGMLAGLLRQPKTRPRGRPSLPPASPEDDPRLLKQHIRELERKLARTEDLVRVLRDLPWASKTDDSQEESRAKQQRVVVQPPRRRRGRPVSPRAEASGGSPAADHAPRAETSADQGARHEPALGA
jgi:hypothetical protein